MTHTTTHPHRHQHMHTHTPTLLLLLGRTSPLPTPSFHFGSGPGQPPDPKGQPQTRRANPQARETRANGWAQPKRKLKTRSKKTKNEKTNSAGRICVNNTPHTSYFLVDPHLMTRTCVGQVQVWRAQCTFHITSCAIFTRSMLCV